MKALILGSTGYTGMMLMRILSSHPQIDQIIPTSRSVAGQSVIAEDPGLHASIVEKLAGTDGCYVEFGEVDLGSVDVVFSALPHKTAASMIGPIVGTVPVIDLSADFRLVDREVYERVYGTTHPHPELLEKSVYGLSEWNRDEIRTASIIACPGCYPTATLLPLLPFAHLIDYPVIVDALSGISGAGRKEERNLLFNERSENMNAYNPGRVHRHVPEIVQELRRAVSAGSSAGSSAGTPADILFTPHLVPIKQGMLVTATARLTSPMSQEEAEAIVTDAYASSPFVNLTTRSTPQSRDVRNTNRCDLSVRVHGDHIQLFSALDNLYKGASGQAIQNMNIRLGLDERSGLRLSGEF